MDQAKFSQMYTNSKDLLGLYCEKFRAVVSLMHVIAGHLKPSLIFASKAVEKPSGARRRIVVKGPRLLVLLANNRLQRK